MNKQTINAVNAILNESPLRNFVEGMELAIDLKNIDLGQPQFWIAVPLAGSRRSRR